MTTILFDFILSSGGILVREQLALLQRQQNNFRSNRRKLISTFLQILYQWPFMECRVTSLAGEQLFMLKNKSLVDPSVNKLLLKKREHTEVDCDSKVKFVQVYLLFSLWSVFLQFKNFVSQHSVAKMDNISLCPGCYTLKILGTVHIKF